MSLLHTLCKPAAALAITAAVLTSACGGGDRQMQTQQAEPDEAEADTLHRFVVLDPGHFHAALVFKPAGYDGVDNMAGIYAPVGEDFVDHMARVEPFNNRDNDPASWMYNIYLAPDYQQEMLEEKFGDIVVLSGRNQAKIDRALAGVQGGFNVLADKPMVIEKDKLAALEQMISTAQANDLLAIDIMTGRHDITNILQREILADPDVFGDPIEGTAEDPAVIKESVHHLYKQVAGRTLKRPWWYFDTAIQGEGLVDVSIHLVDIIFWVLFPGQSIDVEQDVEMLSASHWPTVLDREMFSRITRKPDFPEQLELNDEGELEYYCNGRMIYKVNGVTCAVQVEWNYEAPEGSGDTHYSVIKGSNAHVVVLQGEEQNYRSELYVEAAPGADRVQLAEALGALAARLNDGDYPGVQVLEDGERWRIDIPGKYRIGHEAHFGQVTQNFLSYLDGEKQLPEWHYSNLYAKYFITTTALQMARQAD